MRTTVTRNYGLCSILFFMSLELSIKLVIQFYFKEEKEKHIKHIVFEYASNIV